MNRKHSLSLRPSQIPNAGKGVYANKHFKAGDFIGEYKGEVIDEDEFQERALVPGFNAYMYDLNNGKTIDAMYSKCKARYINDAHGLKRVRGLKNNAEYFVDSIRDKVLVYAKTDIHEGQEIFAPYGTQYWDAVREEINNN